MAAGLLEEIHFNEQLKY